MITIPHVIHIYSRALIYMYPFNVINWVKTVLLAGVMSISLGGVYLGIRWRYWDAAWQADPIFEEDNVNDRLGFHHAFMAVGVWPVLLSMITEEWRAKRPVTRDVDDRLYSKTAYILTKVSHNFPMVQSQICNCPCVL